MTAVLPLTEDEETGLRRSYGVFSPSAGSGTDTVLRLFATLDAERAKGPDATLCLKCRSPHDGSQWNACEYCSVARTRFINALEETLGVEGRNLSADETLEVVRARLSPPPSRSDARRIAAHRGEPAPVFDAPRWRPEVAAFADAMEAQLRANDHKGGWHDDALDALLERLREEAAELEDSLSLRGRAGNYFPNDPKGPVWHEEVLREAADVANFAMMIADNADRLAPKAESPAPPYPASVVEAVRALEVAWTAAFNDGGEMLHDEDCPACGGFEEDCTCPTSRIRSALASLPAELLEAARRAT